MEMSFFWKLRNAWWTLKGTLGVGASSVAPPAPAVDPGLVEIDGFEGVRFRGVSLERSTSSVDVAGRERVAGRLREGPGRDPPLGSRRVRGRDRGGIGPVRPLSRRPRARRRGR